VSESAPHDATPDAPPPASRRLRPGLADWIDLLALLRRDEERPRAELHRRDRALGRRLGELPEGRRLVAWVRAARRREEEHDAAGELPGGATAASVAGVSALLALVSFLLGVSTATGLFTFGPGGRINVVTVFGTLVCLPGVFLLLALANALPTRLRSKLPGLGAEPEGGGPLQPARWALRLLPPGPRDMLEELWGRGRGLERLSAPVRRWVLLSTSQAAALAFQSGALVACLTLVVFTDLSFGWSTTLEVEPAALHRTTSLLAAPWGWAWPAAVPGSELVETTRYFRIAAEPEPGVPLSLYGAWWPFVVMSLGVYGWLPRAVFLVVARLRLRRALARAVLETPGSRAVLDRLESPLVETRSPGRDAEAEAADADAGPEEAAGAALPTRAVVVSWSEALDDAPDLGCEPLARFEAGGRRAPEDDERAAADAAAAAQRQGVPVVLAVRGFEPPLGEVMDFLGALRAALGDGRDVLVVPRGGEEPQRRAWRRRLASLGDPWLAVAAAPAAPRDDAASVGAAGGAGSP